MQLRRSNQFSERPVEEVCNQLLINGSPPISATRTCDGQTTSYGLVGSDFQRYRKGEINDSQVRKGSSNHGCGGLRLDGRKNGAANVVFIAHPAVFQRDHVMPGRSGNAGALCEMGGELLVATIRYLSRTVEHCPSLILSDQQVSTALERLA